MPTAALRPCATCHTVGCTAHVKAAWTHRRPVERIRGRKLQTLRKRLFDTQTLCVRCQTNGRVSVATIRDHVIPLAEGGQDVESNVQPLCQACSDIKTQQESQRGRHRARGG